MIEVDAIVTASIGKSIYRLKPQHQQTCGSCHSQSSCASGAFLRLFPVPDKPLVVNSARPLRIGQQVTIGINERAIQQFAFLIYLLPLVMLFAGALLGDFLTAHYFNSDNEITTIVAGLAGMMLGFYSARMLLHTPWLSKNNNIVVIEDKTPSISIEAIDKTYI